MCFSFQASISTFIVSWSISIYLLNKKLTSNQRHNVIMLMIFSSMQALDAILWYVKMKKNVINYIITSFAIPLVLSLQLYYNLVIVNKFDSPYVLLGLLLATIYMFFKFNGYSKSLCNNKLASPIWGNNEIKIWEFILFAILVLYPSKSGIFMSIFIVLPIIYFYFGGAYGSLWCALANYCAIDYLIRY